MRQQYRSTLDVIYENWRDYNDKLCTAIAPLTDVPFLLQPAPRMQLLCQAELGCARREA